MDDSYFMSLLDTREGEAVAHQDEIVVWTKEYVRSQMGEPLQDTAVPRPMRSSGSSCRDDNPQKDETRRKKSRAPIVGADRCLECLSFNDKACYSRSRGGVSCEVSLSLPTISFFHTGLLLTDPHVVLR